jgi:ADP-ribosylglycohydrolase
MLGLVDDRHEGACGDRTPLLERIRGAFLAGAVGDALGAPVEFLSLDEIRARFGSGGVRELAPAYGRAGAITDDTQMTLFTAEGLVLAARAGALDRTDEVARIVHRAYLRWLRTQGGSSAHPSFERAGEGWLLDVAGLHAVRAPGSTCLAALRSGRLGRMEQPLNTSKGCGAVMRMAPVGLARAVGDPFRTGCALAALTHGHPSGWLAAGFLAAVVRELAAGTPLEDAARETLVELRRWPGSEECAGAVDRALALAGAGPATTGAVQALGEGWVAEEALAISLYCALAAPDLESALRLAVNHGGDSDSTGAITGNLLGAIHGERAIPRRWLEALELRAEIERVAEELHAACGR